MRHAPLTQEAPFSSFRRRRILPPEKKKGKTHSHTRRSQTHMLTHFSYNGQLVETSRGRGGDADGNRWARSIGLHIFTHQRLKTLLTTSRAQMSQGPLISLNSDLSAIDLSAVSFCMCSRWGGEKAKCLWLRLNHSNQAGQLVPWNTETFKITLCSIILNAHTLLKALMCSQEKHMDDISLYGLTCAAKPSYINWNNNRHGWLGLTINASEEKYPYKCKVGLKWIVNWGILMTQLFLSLKMTQNVLSINDSLSKSLNRSSKEIIHNIHIIFTVKISLILDSGTKRIHFATHAFV